MYLNIFNRKLCMCPVITTQESGLAGVGWEEVKNMRNSYEKSFTICNR